MVSKDYTNINSNADKGRYTSDIVDYDDANLATLKEKVQQVQTIMNSTLLDHWNQVKAHEHLWDGKSKEEYNELKRFIDMYHEDFSVSIGDYKTSIDGIPTLLGSLKEANVIKEIDAL